MTAARGTSPRFDRRTGPGFGTHARAAGFVLAAVLWILAALALLAAYIHDVATDNVLSTDAQKRALQDELDARSTENTLIYLLASSRTNHRGLVLEREQRFVTEPGAEPSTHPGDGTLPLSGEAHIGIGRTRFALQDELGLVSINSPDEPTLVRAFRHVGVPAADAARLIPRVRDYIDLDSRITLSGAERFDYRQAGRPPPANWFMAAAPELRAVLGVDDVLTADQWRRLRPLLTSRLQFGYNFNTMPPGVVAALLGSAEAAEPLIEHRAEEVIGSVEQVREITGEGLWLNADYLLTVPSPTCRIAVWTQGGVRRSVLGITLTPGNQKSPWRKEYRYSEPVDGDPRPVRQAKTPLFQPA